MMKEIHEKNDWFTYGEPLHRIREFGIPVKAVDLLDERALTGDQIRMVASVMYVASSLDIFDAMIFLIVWESSPHLGVTHPSLNALIHNRHDHED